MEGGGGFSAAAWDILKSRSDQCRAYRSSFRRLLSCRRRSCCPRHDAAIRADLPIASTSYDPVRTCHRVFGSG